MFSMHSPRKFSDDINIYIYVTNFSPVLSYTEFKESDKEIDKMISVCYE